MVWWARLADYRPGLDDFLSTSEVGRSDRLVRAADRVRQRLGAALLRCAVAELTGSAPRLPAPPPPRSGLAARPRAASPLRLHPPTRSKYNISGLYRVYLFYYY